MWLTGLAALCLVGFSWIRDGTRVPRITRFYVLCDQGSPTFSFDIKTLESCCLTLPIRRRPDRLKIKTCVRTEVTGQSATLKIWRNRYSESVGIEREEWREREINIYLPVLKFAGAISCWEHANDNFSEFTRGWKRGQV